MVQHGHGWIVIDAGQATYRELRPVPLRRRAEKHVIQGRLAKRVRRLGHIGQGDDRWSQLANASRLLLLFQGQSMFFLLHTARGLHFMVIQPMNVVLIIDGDC